MQFTPTELGKIHLERETMASMLLRFCPADGRYETAIDGLSLFRVSTVSSLGCGITKPVFAMMAQGAKRILVGEDTFDYDPSHYFVSSLELPSFAQITKASVDEPYLGFALTLDPLKISDMDNRISAPRLAPKPGMALAVDKLTRPIFDAASSLLHLLNSPQDIAVLAPLAEQQLLYHLLRGPMGDKLRHVANCNGHSYQISAAMQWIRNNLEQSLSIDALAALSNMSKSSFHQHFKALTAMSPLQYQKQLRLQEARRLMLTDSKDAASAAHKVGYESPSQFSREYRRMFGAPPARDIAQLRQTTPAMVIAPGFK